MKFATEKPVRFHHCDPAGIVFYPPFFYQLHQLPEDFLTPIGCTEDEFIMVGQGIPGVDLKTEFVGMGRDGDPLRLGLELTGNGHTSIGMVYEIDGRPHRSALDENKPLKPSAHGVVVHSERTQGKAFAIPDSFRSALLPFLKNQSNT